MSKRDDNEAKRVPKCPGCGVEITCHQWGPAHKFCDGPQDENERDERDGEREPRVQSLTLDETIEELERELHTLCVEEEERKKEDYIRHLRSQVSARRAALANMRSQESDPPSTAKELKQRFPQAPDAPTPLDGLLNPIGLMGAASSHGLPHQNLMSQAQGQSTVWEDKTSEMFLKPTTANKGEKVLRIVDYIDSIIARDEERTISDGGNAKLVVSYGPKKPRLEHITVQQWVVANTRIFYNLLASNKLISHSDIQHYLAYTIKIMELSNRYQWVSILKYDDEFRHLQATYNYPWSFDSNHLHTVILEPIQRSTKQTTTTTRAPSPRANTNFAVTTNDGRVICRNFNSARGCTFNNCNYEHVCNRKVNGDKSCGQTHPGVQHNSSQQ